MLDHKSDTVTIATNFAICKEQILIYYIAHTIVLMPFALPLVVCISTQFQRLVINFGMSGDTRAPSRGVACGLHMGSASRCCQFDAEVISSGGFSLNWFRGFKSLT